MYHTTHIIQDFISTKSPVKFSDTHYVHDSPQSNLIRVPPIKLLLDLLQHYPSVFPTSQFPQLAV